MTIHAEYLKGHDLMNNPLIQFTSKVVNNHQPLQLAVVIEALARVLLKVIGTNNVPKPKLTPNSDFSTIHFISLHLISSQIRQFFLLLR